MMIDAVLSPVRGEKVNVEIPALDFTLALRGDFEGARAERRRRESGWTAQTFLRATVNGVHLPIVDLHRTSSERGDRVEQEQSACVMRQDRNFFDGGQRARGGFGVDDRDEFRAGYLFERGGDL